MKYFLILVCYFSVSLVKAQTPGLLKPLPLITDDNRTQVSFIVSSEANVRQYILEGFGQQFGFRNRCPHKFGGQYRGTKNLQP